MNAPGVPAKMDTANLPVRNAAEKVSQKLMTTANVPVSVTNLKSQSSHTNMRKKAFRLTFPLAWKIHTLAAKRIYGSHSQYHPREAVHFHEKLQDPDHSRSP